MGDHVSSDLPPQEPLAPLGAFSCRPRRSTARLRRDLPRSARLFLRSDRTLVSLCRQSPRPREARLRVR